MRMKLGTVVWGGVIIGLASIAFILPGGVDAQMVFLKDRFLIEPPYVNMVLKLVSWLPWPGGYAVMNILTLAGLVAASRVWRVKVGWVLLSMPLVWNLWCGQVDWMVAAGIALAWLILEKKASVKLTGIAAVLMMAKPWFGAAPMVLLGVWIWKEYRWKAMIALAAAVIIVVGALFVIYGIKWPQEWLGSLLRNGPPGIGSINNGGLPPGLGLIGWVFVPFGEKGRKALLRRVVTAGMLMMPVLTFYELVILVVMVEDNWVQGFMLAAGWIAWMIPGGLKVAWVLPSGALVYEAMKYGLVELRIKRLQRRHEVGS